VVAAFLAMTAWLQRSSHDRVIVIARRRTGDAAIPWRTVRLSAYSALNT
jgi:hypothetical protein